MSTRESRTAEWKALLSLFALGWILRLIHQLTIQSSPFVSLLFIDPLMYDEWALRIADGQWMSDRPFFLDPLYPYFLAAIYAVAGHSIQAVIFVQALLGALVAPLLFAATLRWFDRRVAWVVGILAAVYIPGIYFGSLVMKPGLSVVFSAVLLWIFSRTLSEKSGWGWWLSAGIIFSMAALTRGNLVVVIPAVALMLLLMQRSRRRLIEVGWMLAGAAMILMLPALHNYKVSGEWILTTANAGANFYIGNNASNETGEYQQLPFIRANPKYEQLDFDNEAKRRSGAEMSDSEISSFWFAETFREIDKDRGHWFGLMFKKVRGFWSGYEIPDSVDYLLFSEYAPLLRVPLPGFGLLGPLALLGLCLALRRPGWPRLMIGFIAAYSATVIIFFVFSRFRMVIAPALYVFAGYGAVELWRRLRERRDWVVAVIIFAAAFAFVNVPVRARVDSWAFRVADALSIPTKPETSAQGHYNLGVVYALEAKKAEEANDAEGKAHYLELAAEQLQRTVDLRGDAAFAVDYMELAKVLTRQQRYDEAIAQYTLAARVEPGNPRIIHGIGRIYDLQGDRLRAAQAYQQALAVQPRFIASSNALGEALLTLGRPQDAAIAFQHTLDFDADNARALSGMRRALAAAQAP